MMADGGSVGGLLSDALTRWVVEQAWARGIDTQYQIV